MFLKKNANVNTNELIEVIKNSQSTVVPPIPALARERNGKIEHLLIGQKSWQVLPEGLVTTTSISHVQHFTDAEPLVIVDVTLASPSTEKENSLIRLFIESIAPKNQQSPKRSAETCACGAQKTSSGGPQSEVNPAYCAGCSYCGGCQPGYCYRACVCNGVQGWCYDHVCCP